MFKHAARHRLLAALLVSCMLPASCGGSGGGDKAEFKAAEWDDAPPPAAPLSTEDRAFDAPGIEFTDGEDIYRVTCAGCHMPEGEGAVGAGAYPALAGNSNLEYPDYAIYIVVNGQKAMPAFGGILSDEQVAAVVNYLQSDLGNAYTPSATPEAVAASRMTGVDGDETEEIDGPN